MLAFPLGDPRSDTNVWALAQERAFPPRSASPSPGVCSVMCPNGRAISGIKLKKKKKVSIPTFGLPTIKRPEGGDRRGG